LGVIAILLLVKALQERYFQKPSGKESATSRATSRNLGENNVIIT
jgi:hypothetical protein